MEAVSSLDHQRCLQGEGLSEDLKALLFILGLILDGADQTAEW